LNQFQLTFFNRLDFLWQYQAREEKLDMEALQSSNKRILFNLLPAHVANHFLDNQFRNNLVSNQRFFFSHLELLHLPFNHANIFQKSLC
jgi:hypothetical protein